MDPSQFDPSQLGALIALHKWVAVWAIVVMLGVRLVKSDTTFPINVSPTARYWVAFGLGLVGSILEKVASATGVVDKTTWTAAIVDGLTSAILAIVTHEGVVESIRGGREFVVPGLMIPGASASPGKAPTVPPKPDPDATPIVITPAIPPPPTKTGLGEDP